MSTKKVIHISNLKAFTSLLKETKKFVIVKYSATWCGPCRAIAPIFEMYATSPDNSSIVFVSVDVDEAADIAEKYDISCMPTFQVFKNGEVIDSFSGSSKEKLLKILLKYK